MVIWYYLLLKATVLVMTSLHCWDGLTYKYFFQSSKFFSMGIYYQCCVKFICKNGIIWRRRTKINYQTERLKLSVSFWLNTNANYSNASVCRSVVCQWCLHFTDGTTFNKFESRSGRPIDSALVTTMENIVKQNMHIIIVVGN